LQHTGEIINRTYEDLGANFIYAILGHINVCGRDFLLHNKRSACGMLDSIFKMIEDLIDIAAFELEFRHRLDNPFNEKWINSSRTRARIQKVRKFLYQAILRILKSDNAEPFYNLALRPYFKYPVSNLIQSIAQKSDELPADPLYRLLFYKLPMNELFIIFTNVVTFEHQNFPYILEYLVIQEQMTNPNQSIEGEDIFKYYIRVLDVLSSSSIVSIFDLDTLKTTVETDKMLFNQMPLKKLKLYTDWSLEGIIPFEKRFPNFRAGVERKIVELSVKSVLN
jgi:hypothetical protein